MRVALDVTPCVAGVTGVARYTATLLDQLRLRGTEAYPFAVGRGGGTPPPGTRTIRVPLSVMQALWVTGEPRAERLVSGVQIVHSCDLVPPPTRRPLVATVHDLAALDRPDLHPPRAARQARRRLAALHSAAAILPVSAATAEALRRHGVCGPTVSVVHVAPPPPHPRAGTRQPAPYLLAVGEVTARKDYSTLIRALAAGAARGHRLVVAGPDGYRSQEVHALVARLGLAERVTFTGRVSDGVLADLYADAAAFCLPSLIEGFGLPLVEAMRAGVPVVASDIDVVREVCADAALTFSPGDVEALAHALDAVVADEDLRSRLAVAGACRAKAFTWDRTVTGTLAAYQRALECA